MSGSSTAVGVVMMRQAVRHNRDRPEMKDLAIAGSSNATAMKRCNPSSIRDYDLRAMASRRAKKFRDEAIAYYNKGAILYSMMDYEKAAQQVQCRPWLTGGGAGEGAGQAYIRTADNHRRRPPHPPPAGPWTCSKSKQCTEIHGYDHMPVGECLPGARPACYFSINYPDFSPYITLAFLGVPNKGNKFKSGYITPALEK